MGSFDALQKLIAKVRPDVLIVDPLSSAHSLDENSIAIKQALNNVDRLIDLYSCAAIIVHHSSTKAARDKQGNKYQKATIEQPRGHSSLVDWCDVHMHFEAFEEALDGDDEPNEAKTIEMSFGKSRYCRRPDKRRLQVNFEAMEVTTVRKRKG
jgi:RecA-family ATPase